MASALLWWVLGCSGGSSAPDPAPDPQIEAIEQFVRETHDASLHLATLGQQVGKHLLDRLEGRSDDSGPTTAALAASDAALADQIRIVEGFAGATLPEAETYRRALLDHLHTQQQINAGPLARCLAVAEDPSLDTENRLTEVGAILGEVDARERASRDRVDRALRVLYDRIEVER